MKNLNQIIRKHLRVISENDGKPEQENYMFFGNIEQMKRQCELLMGEDKNQIDSILKEHDWAQDHISEAKSLLDQVFDFLMNQTKGEQYEDEMINEESQIDEGKNKPTNPKLWARAKSMAKSKFKVYPSAYANGWAAKWYKKHGGGWRKTKK
jgi:hypothetical protein